jgi:hypothetical protein
MQTRYIGLDFDQCICELGEGFNPFWSLLKDSLKNGAFQANYLEAAWKKELVKAYKAQTVTFINPEIIELLTHINGLPANIRPNVFVYTNNSSEERVAFIHDIIEEIIGSSPWIMSFHPKDPSRLLEHHSEAITEPGKSYDGINNCLGRPEDLNPQTLLFFDDVVHPLQAVLGERYIHVNPAFHCHDRVIQYLKTFVMAWSSVPHELAEDVRFRLYVRNALAHFQKKLMSHFPAPCDMYQDWNLGDWYDYYELFTFGSVPPPAEQERSSLFARALPFLMRDA